MAGVRKFCSDDLPGVVALYEEVVRSGTRTPPLELAGYVERVLLDHPWATPEVPSLVHEGANGEVLGFAASYPARLLVDGEPALGLVSGSLVASPQGAGAGGLLTRKQLGGVQELSLTDGANDATYGLWSALGGQPLLHGAVEWHRTLRPGPKAGAVLAAHGHPRSVQRIGAVVTGARDVVRRRLVPDGSDLAPPEVETRSELLTPEVLVEVMGSARWTLRVDYDLPYLRWLFARLEESVPVRGPVVRQVVLRPDRARPEGWYVYHLAPAGVADVLAVVGLPGRTGKVLDHLMADAWQRGAHEVQGRLDASLAEVVNRPGVRLFASAWPMVHTRDPQMLARLSSPRSALTRLDGEWWMSHHLLFR